MGVASGCRDMTPDRGLQGQLRHGERSRQEGAYNPITGETGGSRPSSRPSSGSRRAPAGNLQAGLIPATGPLDHMTAPEKDLPGRRLDPTRNQSSSLQPGVACVAPGSEQQRGASRITESSIVPLSADGGLGPREPTPERRRTPGQVVRGGIRPKDCLASGCVASERSDHPQNLPRPANPNERGSLVPGPCGMVPMGTDFVAEDVDLYSGPKQPTPFKPLWG
ncbi:unnamed protein product [Prorocentrum cordatum]|uniref:Uncharacterized protein n=1 Tax=Prorocentrum cordatum TaxID=2364126 RepID=A0ABN9VLF5_9DINO|nr:unnamed protein product [Polarella glacialis]